MTLTIAVAYGGREEIADAVRDLIRAKVRDRLGVDETSPNTSPGCGPLLRPILGEASYGNVVLSCGVGNGEKKKKGPGGAGDFRTYDLRSARMLTSTRSTSRNIKPRFTAVGE